MLQMHVNCEACGRDLPPDCAAARICSFECTFCAECAAGRYADVCPNCGGELVRRPIRPPAQVDSSSGSSGRILKDHGADLALS